MVFDLDIENELPPWELIAMCDGVLITVSKPTGEQVERMADLRNCSRQAAYIGFCKLFSELTRIDPQIVAAKLDAEVICSFFASLGNLMLKRMEYRHQLRTRQQLVNPLPAAGIIQQLN
jgi:hypothetical protein